MRVALVHDYLNQRGGAERVFAHFAREFADAPVYTALYDEAKTGDLVPKDRVRTSFLAGVPGANAYFRYLAPLYPIAFERFDLSGFDTVVSSTTAWAKGVIVPRDAVHVCYINTVSRFTFAYDRYVRNPLLKPLVAPLVAWDKRAAQRPTLFVANSRNVAARVRRYYDRDARVLHCPVDVDRFRIGAGSGDYFFIASRLLPYKRIDLAIEAADRARVPLRVAGTGPQEAQLRERAKGTTTSMLGFVPDDELAELMGNARALVLPGEEDFGLVPLEAAASGRPTIAARIGGALETIVEHRTGVFFEPDSSSSLADALRSFDASAYDPHELRTHAETFAPAVFRARLRSIVEEVRAQRGRL